MVLVVGDQQEQEEWYQAIKKLMEEERKDEDHGEGFDEEDDGYCTLPPAPFFKEVRPDFSLGFFVFLIHSVHIKLIKMDQNFESFLSRKKFIYLYFLSFLM